MSNAPTVSPSTFKTSGCAIKEIIREKKPHCKDENIASDHKLAFYEQVKYQTDDPYCFFCDGKRYIPSSWQ